MTESSKAAFWLYWVIFHWSIHFFTKSCWNQTFRFRISVVFFDNQRNVSGDFHRLACCKWVNQFNREPITPEKRIRLQSSGCQHYMVVLSDCQSLHLRSSASQGIPLQRDNMLRLQQCHHSLRLILRLNVPQHFRRALKKFVSVWIFLVSVGTTVAKQQRDSQLFIGAISM